MALVNLPSVKNAKTLEEVIDVVEKMRKEMEFLFDNVENDNIRGQIEASKIIIGGGTTYEEGHAPVTPSDLNMQILMNYKKQLETTKAQIDAKYTQSYKPVPSIKVATWNLYGGRNQDSHYIDLSKDSRNLLKAGGYDLVGLQEVVNNYSKSISKWPLPAIMGNNFYAGRFYEAQTYYEPQSTNGNGLISKKYGISNIVSWDLPKGYLTENKILTRSEFILNGKKIYVFVTHFHWEDDNVRANEMQFLKSKIEELNGATFICFGDFNVKSLSEFDILSSLAYCVNGLGGYSFDTYNFDNWPTRKIDNIIYSKDFTITARGVTTTDLSDHSLLWATLNVPDWMKTKKAAFDAKYTDLLSSIDSAVADGEVTEAEKTNIDSKISAYRTAISDLGITFDLVIQEISNVDAQQFANNLFEVVQSDIQQVQDNLDTFSGYVDGAFYDGVVSEAEASAIRTHINSLNAEKADIDNRYTQISTNSNLPSAEKTALTSKKTAYDTAHTNLITEINNAIADSKATAEERVNVDTKFTLYQTSLADLSTQFEKAINAISAELARIAESNSKGYADGKDTALRGNMRLIAPLPTSLTLDANGITATNDVDANKYARLDYRGLYVKQGAIAIERSDGYLVMDNGTANFDFSIDQHEPPFIEDSRMTISGIFFKSRSYDWINCNYYSYKHTGRYLKVLFSVKADSGTTGWVRIVDGIGGGSELWRYSTTSTTGYGVSVTATVDLGIPTGQLKSFYIQASTSDSTEVKAGYVRVLRKWLEG